MCKKKFLDLQASCIFYIQEVHNPFYEVLNYDKGDKKNIIKLGCINNITIFGCSSHP